MYKRIFIPRDERALLVSNAKIVEYLGPGRHWRFGLGRRLALEKLDATRLVLRIPEHWDIEGLIPADEAKLLRVPADHAALVRQEGVPKQILEPGRYLVWVISGEVGIEVVDLRTLRSTIPVEFDKLAPESMRYEALIGAHERAVLYVDGVLTELLEPGRHRLSPWGRKLRITRVDLREQELSVLGQELITADKASLRLNLIARYRVVDPVALFERLDSLRDAVYAAAQVAARHVVAGVTVDELLIQRAELSEQIVARVSERCAGFGVELVSLDIKDVILPGDLKELLNQVIEAEKRAAAQVIMRREEVAATRSLANTARLLEQNPVLLRLKELESLKELAERVPQLSVFIGSEDIQRQLRFTASGK